MILEHDQVLYSHAIPNWLRVVSHSQRRRGGPPTTIPQGIETSTVMGPPFDSTDSQGMFVLRLMLHLGAYFAPQGIRVIHARLVVAPPGPPLEMINTQYECGLCTHRHKAPLLMYLHRPPQLTGSPSRRANRAFCKLLLFRLTDM